MECSSRRLDSWHPILGKKDDRQHCKEGEVIDRYRDYSTQASSWFQVCTRLRKRGFSVFFKIDDALFRLFVRKDSASFVDRGRLLLG